MSEAPAPSWTRSLVVALAAWLIPGAGHLILGRRLRALGFFALVMVSLLIGCALEGKLWTGLEANNPILSRLGTIASFGMGVPYLLLRFALAYQGNLVGPGYEYGAAFVLTAGLMNLLLILDAWDISRGEKD